jgi:hypothetical protein
VLKEGDELTIVLKRKGYEDSVVIVPNARGRIVRKLKPKPLAVNILNEPFITSLEEYRLEGKVKSIRTESARFTEGSGHLTEIDRKLKSEMLLNKNGKLVEVASYNADGTQALRIVITIDQNGDWTTMTQYAGEVIKSKWVLNYNKIGKDTEVVMTDTTGSVMAKCRFIFDGEGNLIEQAYYSGSGTLQSKNVLTYEDGRVLTDEKFVYKVPEALEGRYLTTRNRDGQMIEYALYRPDNKLAFRYQYYYDSRGNLVELVRYSGNETVETKEVYEYIFDNNGNWVSKIRSVQDGNTMTPLDVQYRAIEYYR